MDYNRKLVLEDGTIFYGNGFGDMREVADALIFYTGMTGYENLLTDPSYAGQMAVMTYPLIGNYGISQEVLDADGTGVTALIVKEYAQEPSNVTSVTDIDSFMKDKEIVGLCDVDTRALTLYLREQGSMRGIIVASDVETEDALVRLKEGSAKAGRQEKASKKEFNVDGQATVAVLDFGGDVSGLVRELNARQVNVVVQPYQEGIPADVQGVMLGHGAGNPASYTDVLSKIKDLQVKKPLFAVGLGHQLFALANGATISEMKNGLHGANVPVKDIEWNRTLITFQNTRYVVEKASLEKTDLTLTHFGINDETVQGLAHQSHPAFSVQFVPEAYPGPADSKGIFDQFVESLGGN